MAALNSRFNVALRAIAAVESKDIDNPELIGSTENGTLWEITAWPVGDILLALRFDVIALTSQEVIDGWINERHVTTTVVVVTGFHATLTEVEINEFGGEPATLDVITQAWRDQLDRLLDGKFREQIIEHFNLKSP